jgi:hypothetical protein
MAQRLIWDSDMLGCEAVKALRIRSAREVTVSAATAPPIDGQVLAPAR